MDKVLVCGLCGHGFVDCGDGTGDLHLSANGQDEHHRPAVDAAGDGWGYVVRRRIRDRSVGHVQMGAPSRVGRQAVSRFLPLRFARWEAAEWSYTGDFVASVVAVPVAVVAGGVLAGGVVA